MSKSILVVDDEKDIRTALGGILEDEGYQVMTAACAEEALEILRQESPDILLLDIWMPGMDGIEALERFRISFPNLTVIMISGHGTIETAVKATKLGAYDFIEKPLSLEKVLISVKNALRMNELKSENEELRKNISAGYDLVGDTPSMNFLRENIARAAGVSTPLLITGEKGTGKGRVARSVHFTGERKGKPFIAVNCASMPEALIDGELFGWEKGAFPGATSQKRGKIEVADGGTLFLNEIGELSLNSQDRIVELLRNKSFERIGGGRRINADVRLVAAMEGEPASEVKKGKLREELYYMINVLNLTVPPLRERRADIPDLIGYFSLQFSRREGGAPKRFTPEALDILGRHEWPGNVRELKNIVERMLIMTPGSVVTAVDIPVMARIISDQGVESGKRDDNPLSGTLRRAREEFEKEFIIRRLEENDWNISKTAEMIELERSNLHRKIKSFGIDVRR